MRTISRRLCAGASAVALTTPMAWASVEDLPVGQPPPDFSLSSTAGVDVTLSGEQGQPTVLIFGELYQDNTRRAAADLQDIIARGERADALRVLLIVSEDRPAEALETERQEAAIPFPVLMDQDRSTFVAYGVISAIPCTVFLDAEGRLHHAVAGYGVSFVDTAEDEIAFLTGRISEEELRSRRRAAPDEAEGAHLQRRARLGDQLRRRGFGGQAREQYEAVLEEAPDHIEARLGLAQIELERSELSAAEEHVRVVLEQDPHLPRGLKTLARIQIRRGDLDAAEIALQELVHRAGEDVQTLYLMGRLSEERGDEPGALRHYRQVCEALLAGEGW